MKYMGSKNRIARDMSKKGHKVFISEYTAPNDFIILWEKKVTNSLNNKLTYKPTERLYGI